MQYLILFCVYLLNLIKKERLRCASLLVFFIFARQEYKYKLYRIYETNENYADGSNGYRNGNYIYFLFELG